MWLLIANSYATWRAAVTRSHLVILKTYATVSLVDEICLALKFTSLESFSALVNKQWFQMEYFTFIGQNVAVLNVNIFRASQWRPAVFFFSKLCGCSELNNTTHIAWRLTHIVSPHSFQAAEVQVRHVDGILMLTLEGLNCRCVQFKIDTTALMRWTESIYHIK